MIITIFDPVASCITKRNASFVYEAMSYETSFWRKKKDASGHFIQKADGNTVKERQTYRRNLFFEKSNGYYYFWTGFVPRIQISAEEKGINVTVNNLYKAPQLSLTKPITSTKDFEFKKAQIRLVDSALKAKRGVIVSPTGTGKTAALQMALMSSMINYKKVIISHTKDIVLQTAEKFEEAGFDVQVMGAGYGVPNRAEAMITIATMQSFHKYLFSNPLRIENPISDEFKMVIIDESHRVSKTEGSYSEILQCLMTEYRYGFTASPKSFEEDPEAYVTSEGLLGPIIDEMTFEEGIKEGLIVRPKVKILRTPFSNSIRDLKTYQDVYRRGIMTHVFRNNLIVETACKAKGSTLVFVNRIEHGEILKRRFDMARKIDTPFVQGRSNNETRIGVRKLLESKEEKIVICTTIWKEGIDIPTLDNVIYAGGLKSDVATLQSIGRGTRRPKGKETVTIYDFFDPSHPFLVDHFGHRITLYMEKGWM